MPNHFKHISHEITSYDNKNVDPEDETVVNIKDYWGENTEDTVYGREILAKYLGFLGQNDVLARDIADLMLNWGITTSVELATHRGLSVREIENGKKRLHRLTLTFCEKNKEIA